MRRAAAPIGGMYGCCHDQCLCKCPVLAELRGSIPTNDTIHPATRVSRNIPYPLASLQRAGEGLAVAVLSVR